MNARVRSHLIRFARNQVGTTSYLNLVQEAELGLIWKFHTKNPGLNEILSEISEKEYRRRPSYSQLPGKSSRLERTRRHLL